MFLIQIAMLIIVTGGFLYLAHIDHVKQMEKKEAEHREFIQKMQDEHREFIDRMNTENLTRRK